MLCERCKRESGLATEGFPDLKSLNLMGLPFVLAADHRDLPHCSAVYFALSPPKICYIGIADDICNRWRHHQHILRLMAEPHARIAWLVRSDKEQRVQIERAAIHYFKPLWNDGGAEYLSSYEIRQQFPRPQDIKFAMRRGIIDAPPCAIA